MRYEKQVYVVMHYPKRLRGADSNPVAKYLMMLLRNKVKNSGRGTMTDDELATFLNELEERYGITLSPEEIVDNGGARQLAKLCMNGIWGRMGINTDRQNTMIVSRFEDLLATMQDQTIMVKDLFMIGDVIKVLYEGKKPFIKTPPYSSLITAVMTTSWGRVELFKYIALLGKRLLYSDTDACIYYLEEGEEDPLPSGHNLGDLEDETQKWGKNAKILEFVSGGAKSYGLKIELEDNTHTYIVKHKGIRANSDTYAKLTFESMKRAIKTRCCNVDQRKELKLMRKVLCAREGHKKDVTVVKLLEDIDEKLALIDKKITVDQFMIRPNRQFQLESVIMKKDWRVNYDKRRLLRGGDSFPRGFVDDWSPSQIPDACLDEYANCHLPANPSLAITPEISWQELEPARTLSLLTLAQLLSVITKRNTQYNLVKSRGTVFLQRLANNFTLLNNDLLFVPYQFPRNWALIVFDRIRMTIKLYNPIRSPDALSEVERELHNLFLNDQDYRFRDEEGRVGSLLSGWQRKYMVSEVPDLPEMDRAGDSGIFVVMYADLISIGADPATVTPESAQVYRASLLAQKEDAEAGFFSLEPAGRRYTVRL